MQIYLPLNHAPTTRLGFTLIETLASLVILGTLLCSLIIARGNLMIQQTRAQNILEANEVLDQLLTKWWTEDSENLKDLTQINEGKLKGNTKHTWRTTPLLANQSLSKIDDAKLKLSKLQVALLDANTQKVVCQIELAMPHQNENEGLSAK